MADLPREFNQWGTLTLELPDFLKVIRDGVNTAVDFLITVMDLLLSALEIVKAFTVAYINPIEAIVKLIVDEVNAILKDLSELGLYITGDWALLETPFDDLKGGFTAYERRMIARLTDSTDPTRPSTTGKTKVFAAFFYQSVNFSQITQLVSYVNRLATFFNVDTPTNPALPTPLITGVKYGLESIGAAGFSALPEAFNTNPNPPRVARVDWQLSTSSAKNPLDSFGFPSPPGFLVTISTRRDGIRIGYDRARKTDGKDDKKGQDKKVQPRESGLMFDNTGRPLVLHGGADMLRLSSQVEYNANTTTDGPKDGVFRSFGVLDPGKNVLVPLETLKQGEGEDETYYYQRAFYVSSAATAAWLTQTYSFEITFDMLPEDPEIEPDGLGGLIPGDDAATPNAAYVRIAAVSEKVIDAGDGHQRFQYDIAGSPFLKASGVPLVMMGATPDGKEVLLVGQDIGPFSEPVEVTFASANTNAYLLALYTALAVLVLSRVDLPTLRELEARTDAEDDTNTLGADAAKETVISALEGKINKQAFARQLTGLEDFRDILKLLYPDIKQLERKDLTAPAFRKDLRQRVLRVAGEMYRKSGPRPDLEGSIVAATEDLRTITWRELFEQNDDALVKRLGEIYLIPDVVEEDPAKIVSETIWTSIDDSEEKGGLAANPWGIGLPERAAESLFYAKDAILARQPQFIEAGSLEGDEPWDRIVEAAGQDIADVRLAIPTRAERKVVQRQVDDEGKVTLLHGCRPQNRAQYFQTLRDAKRLDGSADSAPVFYLNKVALTTLSPNDPGGENALVKRGGVVFVRSILGGALDNVIFRQARLVLGFASAAIGRPSKDTKWFALRPFAFLPPLGDVMDVISKWLDAILAAVKGAANIIVQFIDFIEARIVKLQQMIREINALIQSVFSFALPKSSGLILLSNGTDGVLSDLVAAENKPSDSPLDYGGGIAVVIPFIPGALFDLIGMIIEMFKAEGGVDPADSTLPDAAGPPALFEEVPEELEAPDPGNGVPEVL